ncbi:MAG: flagellar filament capping protein FliD [Candidatus Cloacimonetes bacterium]|nr:flagellar filament capping protein FliD [Candidatus Cloacimonadota bacterium]
MSQLGNGLGLSTGIISGIDSGQLVQALTSRQQEPIYSAERLQHSLRIKKEEYQSINSAFASLEDSMLQLSLNSTFNKKAAQYSDSEILKASPNTDAEVASYDIEVKSLAQVHKIASDKLASSSAAFTTSDSTIKLNGTSLQFESGVSLNDIRDGINGVKENTGVTASIINNTLTLTSDTEGKDGRIQLQQTDGTLLNDIGLLEDNTHSNITPDDTKGEFFKSKADASFVSTAGVITAGGLDFTLSGGESTTDIANIINSAGLSNITAFVKDDRLVVANETGNIDIVDKIGSNISDLTSPPDADTGEFSFYNTEEQTIVVNHQQLVIPAFSSINDINQVFNDNSVGTGVTSSIQGGQLVFASGSPIDIYDKEGTLAFDLGLEANQPKNVLQEATDAEFILDGLSISRSSNEIDDVIDNVTLNLTKVGSTSVDIDYDVDNTRTHIESFLEKYNNALSLVHEKSTFKKDYKIKALTKSELSEMSSDDIEERETALRNQALSGDPLLQRSYNMLRQISYRVTDGGTNGFTSLSALGISSGSIGSNKDQTRTGTLKITDEDKFTKALKNNMADIRTLFAQEAEDDEPVAKKGIAEFLKVELKNYTSFDGHLTRVAGTPNTAIGSSTIDVQIATLSLEILTKNTALIKYQEGLLSQFTAMESTMAQLQDQGNQLAQAQ